MVDNINTKPNKMGGCSLKYMRKGNHRDLNSQHSDKNNEKAGVEQIPIKNQMIKRKLRDMGDNLYRGVTIRMITGQTHKKWIKSEMLNSYYYGGWDKGEWNGRGILYFPEKEKVLIATFTAGKPVIAMVKVIESDGTLYTGPLSEKYEYQGNGTLENRKSFYEGEFLENLFHGKGVYRSERERFDGTFLQGKKNQGTLMTPKGTYIGQFKNDQPSGKGEYFWEDGGRYEGEFKQGEMNGKGKLFDADGVLVRSGRWEKGKMIFN